MCPTLIFNMRISVGSRKLLQPTTIGLYSVVYNIQCKVGCMCFVSLFVCFVFFPLVFLFVGGN